MVNIFWGYGCKRKFRGGKKIGVTKVFLGAGARFLVASNKVFI